MNNRDFLVRTCNNYYLFSCRPGIQHSLVSAAIQIVYFLIGILFLVACTNAKANEILESEEFITYQKNFQKEFDSISIEMDKVMDDELQKILSTPGYRPDYRNPSVKLRMQKLMEDAIRFTEKILSRMDKDRTEICRKRVEMFRSGDLQKFKNSLNDYIADEHHILFPIVTAGYATSQLSFVYTIVNCDPHSQSTPE